MTLLERWDSIGPYLAAIRPKEIRRAIAIAQAVDEWGSELSEARGERLTAKELILDRADELLRVEGKP